MKIDKTVAQYLAGETISSAAYMAVPFSGLVSRDRLLVKLAKDKSVIHVGCADHIDLIAKKRKKGNYLHDLLVGSAESVIGVDVNVEAIEAMARAGITDVYHVDSLDKSQHYDIMLIPDVIEHVANVGKFLDDIKQYKNVDSFVVTTPNAYRLQNRRLWRRECINTDHRYWFSPYTLTKCLVEAGFRVDKIYYADSFSWASPLKGLKTILFPICRDSLVVTFKRSEPGDAG